MGNTLCVLVDPRLPLQEWRYKYNVVYLIWSYNISYTVNPLYTDARYNDEIRYNGNLTAKKPALKSW